ncbi:hypothetical protein BS78_K104100 [Paspalum vaginatum]|uniref:Disease resistance protein At4g27190-like leucine-rich repeats domain-containing protein n=1 Tax=Paspalum vaginatum TaxID=158149 RepID=A0A9W7X876_9POAL|nr:hypothetical protein BS78_K104100 [Paspalum vaginatum]
MPKWDLSGRRVFSVEAAVRELIRLLEDTGRAAHKAIYFDGWDGLAASAVLRAIAERPPPSLMKKFDRIIHVDCSRWKSRRALQRAIADELQLPQAVMAAFDRQDEEDDFSNVDESSRAEMEHVTREIYQTVRDLSCLLIFHNGSDKTIDFSDFGFPLFKWLSPCRVLWTFRGRLRLNPEIIEKVDTSHLITYSPLYWGFDGDTAQLIVEEATEVVNYIQRNKQGIDPNIAAKCISYLLWFNKKGGGTINYDWATHASNYWVCDGIFEGDGQFDEPWDVSAALHQQIRIEDCSTHEVNFRENQYIELWKSVTRISESGGRTNDIIIPSKLTSFFLGPENGLHISLPSEMFQESRSLRVLKLFGCKFSFYSPPFQCCRSLRFLGLDNCEDQQQQEDDKQGRPVMEFFRSLWVLDISHTDWELNLSQDLIQQMAINIREVHVMKGRIWHNNLLLWRTLRNLHKLRVIEPTCSWETGKKDEFTDMVKLQLLDLSGNEAIQVLPSLHGATSLRSLVLDGCVGLKSVGPEELPWCLESFSLDMRKGKANKLICISLAGCARLSDLNLRGSFAILEEVDLSGTRIKTVDLKAVDAPCLQRLVLLACVHLRAILWPEKGMQQLRLLCIDTRGGVSHDPLVSLEQEKSCRAFISITDMKFLQTLDEKFIWGQPDLKLNLCLLVMEAIKDDGRNCRKEMTGPRSNKRQIIHKGSSTYMDVDVGKIISDHSKSSAAQPQPLGFHVEIGEGISGTDMQSTQGIKAVTFVMDRVQSLHVHDNSSITTVIPEHMMSVEEVKIRWHALSWCHVERCPRLDTVFATNYDIFCFRELEIFSAAHLLMARSVWSRGRIVNATDSESFAKLRAIHLHMCPRLQFVLPLSWFYTLSSLETLHIVCCGDLRQVFPVEAGFLNRIATEHRNGMLEFPRLKHLYLHHLSSLRQICEAKMFAPKLETVRLRGCWGLRRLPATDRRRVVVDCEKDWWDNLEWDGLHVGHHPSLFAPYHSAYYKKRHLRGTVLR